MEMRQVAPAPGRGKLRLEAAAVANAGHHCPQIDADSLVFLLVWQHVIRRDAGSARRAPTPVDGLID